MKNFVLFFSFLLFSIIIGAQSIDEQLAVQYYQAGEYEKAKLYYEKLYKKTDNYSFYQFYTKTLVQLQEFKEAETVIKEYIRKHPDKVEEYVNLGLVQEQQGNDKKANKTFETAVFNIQNIENCQQLANAFTQQGKYDWALKCYEKGESDLSSAKNPFVFEKGIIYNRQGNYQKMIDDYLNYLDKNPRDISDVQRYLSRNIQFDKEENKSQYLKENLLKKVQKSPQKTHNTELLIWYFQQKKNFKAATIQAKALDKRLNEDGSRVYALGRIAFGNDDYKTAGSAFKYIIDKGSENYYYLGATRLMLKTLEKQLLQKSDYSNEDIIELNNNYKSTLANLPNRNQKAHILYDYAYFLFYFKHDIPASKEALTQALAVPQLSAQWQNKIKLRQADVMMIDGEIWDASLVYSQVEKAMKEDVIGHEAKFKKARLYYYTGDFEWAQTQLDVLKASTSKLISNDAMDLSLLITDNYNLDTTQTNMQQFATADLYILQNKLIESERILDSLASANPNHSLNDEILYKKYEIAFKRRQWEKAKQHLSKIIEEYPDGILADNALFLLAKLEENQFNNQEKAKEYYKQILFNYPGSLYVIEARKKFRAL